MSKADGLIQTGHEGHNRDSNISNAPQNRSRSMTSVMKPFLILLTLLSSLLPLGCSHVVTSQTPDKLYQIQTKTGKYWLLDGIPYFLPKAKVHVDITWNKDENNWIIKVAPVIQPDYKSPQFILKADSNALFDDEVTLTVDQNGLLQTVNVLTTDRTVAAIADLAAAVGNVFTFGIGLAPMAKKKVAEGEEPPPLPSSHHADYDPDEYVGKPLPPIKLQTPVPKPYLATFKFGFTPHSTSPSQIDTTPDSYPIRGIVEESSGNVGLHGIIVRTPVPYEIKVTANDNPPQSTILMLPDVKQAYIFPINRRYLVQDKTNVTLKDGMIQSIQLVRPSMVAGIVGIPKSILSALVPIPLQIRQSQVNNLQAIDTTLKLKKDIKELQSQ